MIEETSSKQSNSINKNFSGNSLILHQNSITKVPRPNPQIATYCFQSLLVHLQSKDSAICLWAFNGLSKMSKKWQRADLNDFLDAILNWKKNRDFLMLFHMVNAINKMTEILYVEQIQACFAWLSTLLICNNTKIQEIAHYATQHACMQLDSSQVMSCIRQLFSFYYMDITDHFDRIISYLNINQKKFIADQLPKKIRQYPYCHEQTHANMFLKLIQKSLTPQKKRPRKTITIEQLENLRNEIKNNKNLSPQ